MLGFYLLKMSMAGRVEVSLIVWLQYIILKLFWRTLGGKWRHTLDAVSDLSKIILKKICNFSLLKEAFSICTNFHDDWLKTWPDIRNLVFLLNEKLYRKSTAVLKVCQRWHHKWNAKTAITLVLNLTLVCIWFLN